MRKFIFLSAILALSLNVSGQTLRANKSPFDTLGYKKPIMFSSSRDQFKEFHDQTDVVEIGSVLFDTRTNQVVGFIDEEQEQIEVPASTPSISVDPLCTQYYWITPYHYCLNNPVNNIDPDGRKLRPTTGFKNSSYGAVYQKLQSNKTYMKIVGKYANSQVNNIDFGVKDKSSTHPERAAETSTSWKTTKNTLNGKITSQNTTYNSHQDYFDVGLTQDGNSLTEIGKARNIIHEGIHSYIAGMGMKESNNDHETFMNYRTMLSDALMEYNTTNNLGFTPEQMTDLSYSGIPQENSQFQSYIQGFADKNGTSYETELGAFKSRVYDMIWEKKTEEK